MVEARPTEATKEHRQRKGTAASSSSAKMTFQQAADLRMTRLNEMVSIKRRTRTYRREILAAILRSWPELAQTEVRRLTVPVCREWAACFAKDSSSTRFNNAIAL